MTESTMNVGGWLRSAGTALAPVTESPALDAELLLAGALGRDRSWLFAHRDEELDPIAREQADARLERRRRGEPLAYITGVREFWSLTLEVTPSVLIPRPETEILVERALEFLPPQQTASVLDLGTGSGAIAIAIASERAEARITATDIDTAALAVARRNADRITPGRIRFVRSDWFRNLAGARYDLIVSNPPYVELGDPVLTDPGIACEPRTALVAGEDGLDAIRRIGEAAAEHLAPAGRILIEHGAMQADGVAGILRDHGLEIVACRRDLGDRDRVTEARLPGASH